jgi:hypothetical protein
MAGIDFERCHRLIIPITWSGGRVDFTESPGGPEFLADRLAQLSQRRSNNKEWGVTEANKTLSALSTQAMNTEQVQDAIANISRVYEPPRPFEKKESMGLLLLSVDVNERRRTTFFLRPSRPDRGQLLWPVVLPQVKILPV